MDVLGNPITLEQMAAHTRRTNKAATSKLLSIIARKRKFVDQLNTELGQILFGKITTRLEELFEKIAEESADEKEKMEFRVTRKLIEGWSERMDEYVKSKNKMQGKG